MSHASSPLSLEFVSRRCSKVDALRRRNGNECAKPGMATRDRQTGKRFRSPASAGYGKVTSRVKATGARRARLKASGPIYQRATQSSLKIVFAAGWVISIFRNV